MPILRRLPDLRCVVRTLTVIRSPEEFRRLSQPNPVTTWAPVPEGVDWGGQMLVVVGSGRRPGKGFSIRVERIERLGGELRVLVRETSPSRPVKLPAPFTYPTDVVVVPRMDLPVRFVVNGFTERVWRPVSAASRPGVSYLDRDEIMRRFGLHGVARERLERAYRAYFTAREEALRWWAFNSKKPGAAEEFRRRLKAAALNLGAAIRRNLSPAQYQLFLRARTLQQEWRRRRRPLIQLLRRPDLTGIQRRACLERVRSLDRDFRRQLDLLFRAHPTSASTSRPAP